MLPTYPAVAVAMEVRVGTDLPVGPVGLAVKAAGRRMKQGALEEAVRVARARAVRKRPSRYGAAPKKPGPQSGSGEIIVAEGGQT